MPTPSSRPFESPPSRSPLAEVDWRAFRYVSGEMSVAESELFETQLAEDQAAREAVAAAVEWMTLALEAQPAAHSVAPIAVERPSPAAPQAWKSALNVVSVAAALVALFAALPLLGRLAAPRAGGGDEDSQLAAAWSATRSTAAALDAAASLPSVEGDDWPTTSEVDSSATTPSWMLAGMAALAADHDESDSRADDAAPQEL